MRDRVSAQCQFISFSSYHPVSGKFACDLRAQKNYKCLCPMEQETCIIILPLAQSLSCPSFSGLVITGTPTSKGDTSKPEVMRWIVGEASRIEASDYSPWAFTYCLKLT